MLDDQFCDYILICLNLAAELSQPFGGVAERLNAPVLKTGMGESPSWVRIPPPPPFIRSTSCKKTFIRIFKRYPPSYPLKKHC